MMQVVPVKFSHIKELERLEGMFFTGVSDDAHVQLVLTNSVGYTLLEGETILGCGGMIMQWPGVGLMWLMATKAMRRRPRTLLRMSAAVLQEIRSKHKIHRFQVFVDPAQSRHVRFVEALGFTLEGRMIQHTVDRKDHLLYARTY
jgi:hypothetical protein